MLRYKLYISAMQKIFKNLVYRNRDRKPQQEKLLDLQRFTVLICFIKYLKFLSSRKKINKFRSEFINSIQKCNPKPFLIPCNFNKHCATSYNHTLQALLKGIKKDIVSVDGLVLCRHLKCCYFFPQRLSLILECPFT